MPLIKQIAHQWLDGVKLLKAMTRPVALVHLVQERNGIQCHFGIACPALAACEPTKYTTNEMTLEELEREYVALRQQGEAVRSYL